MNNQVGPHHEPFVVDEVIKRDCYGMRKFYLENPEIDDLAIIDIGANVGTFSILATCLFPDSRRIAVEGATDTFVVLKENMANLNVKSYNFALGESGKFYTYDVNMSHGSRIFKKAETGVKAYTLSEMFGIFNPEQKKYIVKVDCEGGEKFILDDKDAVPILKNTELFVCELHFGINGLTKTEWHRWALKNFQKTHNFETALAGNYGGIELEHFRMIRRG